MAHNAKYVNSERIREFVCNGAPLQTNSFYSDKKVVARGGDMMYTMSRVDALTRDLVRDI
jgi:hypothetical protein